MEWPSDSVEKVDGGACAYGTGLVEWRVHFQSKRAARQGQ